MLKTRVSNEIWLVHQPDHARVSGYLAAHWGGANGFARPGHYPGATHPELWCEEVVLAIAQHDNGWWEWEATPPIDERDGLPVGLADIARLRPDDGFQRWRVGVPRLAEEHAYAALLTSLHSFWLYAVFRRDITRDAEDPFRHPLFGGRDGKFGLMADADLTRRFLLDQRRTQRALKQRLRGDELFADALKAEHLNPHLRLLQVLDGLSLLLSFNDRDEHEFVDVPRGSWDDRVTITWRPSRDRRILCDPYPFDADPLEVFLPVRVIEANGAGPESLPAQPLTRLHYAALRAIRFELHGAGQ